MSTSLCHFVLRTQYQREHCICEKQTTDCTSQTYKALFMDCEQLLCYSNLSLSPTERGGKKEEPRKRGHTIVEFAVGQELHMSCQTTLHTNAYVSQHSFLYPHQEIQWAIVVYYLIPKLKLFAILYAYVIIIIMYSICKCIGQTYFPVIQSDQVE